jgi:hypothetical protein
MQVQNPIHLHPGRLLQSTRFHLASYTEGDAILKNQSVPAPPRRRRRSGHKISCSEGIFAAVHVRRNHRALGWIMEVQCGDNQVDLSRKIIHCFSPTLGSVILNHKRAHTQLHRRPHMHGARVWVCVCARAYHGQVHRFRLLHVYERGVGRAKESVTTTPYSPTFCSVEEWLVIQLGAK